MSNKDYPDYISNSHKSYDKNIIVEELLEKLKAQGCFDAKRKQFLSEITNKSSYQNLHTKVENLATKFLETVRWPPSVQKHQLREQLRLHIQSTDQFNNSVSRLIEQEVSCKIQGELKPMIESKACEYLEVNYEKWKQNMLTQIYETLQAESPTEKFTHKVNIKKEISNDSKRPANKEIQGSHSIDSTLKHNIKLESTLNQSNIVNSSSLNTNLHPQPKYTSSSHIPPQVIHSNFIDPSTPTMPPPITVLPPPHRLLFQSFPPPPSMLLSIERFPPPPPPEDKTLPPPPPPENGPNTPTEEYNPKFGDVTDNSIDKIKIGLLKTPEKPMDKAVEVKIFSPKKMIWGQIVLPLQDISDDTASDSDKFDHECRRFSRKSPPKSRNSNTVKDRPKRHYNDAGRQIESIQPQRRTSRVPPRTHSRQKANEYTDVSSDSLNEMEFKDAAPTSTSQILNKKPTKSSSSDDSHSSSSNDHTLDLIRKINKKKKTKLRNRQATPVRSQSSSSYSSSESSSESSSSDNSQRNDSSNTYRDSHKEFRVFGRSQSKEKDMDISIETQPSPLEAKWDNSQAEINLDSLDSVQKRKNQIKARLEEIDAKRSLLQKQQLLSTSEPMSLSNTTSSSSTDSSSDNTSSSTGCGHNQPPRKSSEVNSKSDTSPKRTSNSESNEVFSNHQLKTETAITEELQVKVDHDSEPEEGELSSESRAGSLRRENNANSSEKRQSIQIDNTDSLKIESLVKETDDCFDESVEMELGSDI